MRVNEIASQSPVLVSCIGRLGSELDVVFDREYLQARLLLFSISVFCREQLSFVRPLRQMSLSVLPESRWRGWSIGARSMNIYVRAMCRDTGLASSTTPTTSIT